MHYFSFNIGDYQKKTHWLSDDEDLAYRRMLDMYYDKESPFPNDIKQISQKIRMRDKQEAVLTVLNEFFVLIDGFWHENRCDREISGYKAMKDGGKNGASKRWGKGDDGHPIDTPLPPLSKGQCQPVTNNHKPITIAAEKDFCEEEILPPCWQDYAEAKGIPDEQIFSSWKKFKDKSKRPWKRQNWEKWIDIERVKHG